MNVHASFCAFKWTIKAFRLNQTFNSLFILSCVGMWAKEVCHKHFVVLSKCEFDSTRSDAVW